MIPTPSRDGLRALVTTRRNQIDWAQHVTIMYALKVLEEFNRLPERPAVEFFFKSIKVAVGQPAERLTAVGLLLDCNVVEPDANTDPLVAAAAKEWRLRLL